MSKKRLLAALAAVAAAVVATAPAQAAPRPPAEPEANGIIAVLIGAVDPITAPLGSTKGSFIDASMVYGSSD
jgi:hypothetical protein